MKLSLSAVCLVAGIGVGGMGLAHAADESPAQAKSIKSAAETFRNHRQDPAASAQKRLDRLGKNLNLKPEQQGAWQAYVGAMIQLAKERGQEMESSRQNLQQGSADISSPDRLDKMVERMRKGADKLAKVAGETRTFHAQLSTEQKTIFDLQARDMRHERMRERMHPGMPS